MNEDENGDEAAGGDSPPESWQNDLSGVVVHGPVVQGRDIKNLNLHWHEPPQHWPKVPRQTPSGTAMYINHEFELLSMDEWLIALRASTPRSLVLSGLPGIGKTSTALRWTERVRERFPGGDIYVDFKELRCDVSEGLRQCLLSLGVKEWCIPATLSERRKLFRSRTHRLGRVLVVLDGVTEPEQVSALIPNAPGSAVLATSASRLGELSLDGVRLMSLPPLDTVAGVRLLAKVCGAERTDAEPDAAARIVDLCGGLPVALQVAAARLALRRWMTLADLAAELADDDRRLAALTLGENNRVSRVFSTAYQELPDGAARAYRRLGLLPGGAFSLPAAAAACGTDPGTVRAALETLAEVCLIEEVGRDRYRFHDLVRLHARVCAAEEESEEERHALLKRVVDYYLPLAAFADWAAMGDRLRIYNHEALRAGRTDPFSAEGGKAAALAWLETERGNLLAVLRAAVRAELYEEACQLAEALTALYLHHRHIADWLESASLGAEAAHHVRDSAAEARLRSIGSRPLLDLGRLDQAYEELQDAVQLADESGHAVLRASVREFLGRYWDRVDPERAIAVYEESLALNVAAEELRGAALARFFLGCTLDVVERADEALTMLEQAYTKFTALGDPRMAARALAAVGTVRARLGQDQEAALALEEAARTLHGEEAFHYEAQALEALADLEERRGDAASARARLVQALEIYESGGSPRADELRDRLEHDGRAPDEDARGDEGTDERGE